MPKRVLRWLGRGAGLGVAAWLVAGSALSVGHAAPDEPQRWGNLSVSPLVISPPLEYIPRNDGPISLPRWVFPNVTPQGLEEILNAAGFSIDERQQLLASSRPDTGHGGFIVFPEPAIVRKMSAQDRAKLYLYLATSPLNPSQQSAYRFYAKTLDDWLGPALTPRIRALVQPLVYRVGGFLFFADLELVRAEIGDGPELQLLVKQLLRQSTVMVTLNVENSTQVNSLVEYWGRGGRKTDIRPLLESIADSVPQRAIDITHLLPELPRRLLYRYPKVTLEDFEKPQLANCFWTALNFFANEPDDSVLDPAVALRRLHTDYYLVQAQLQLGDVVAFSDGDIENIFHVAVYVADDLVFTKNGYFSLAPWTIVPMDRLKGHFAEHPGTWRVTYYRRKDL